MSKNSLDHKAEEINARLAGSAGWWRSSTDDAITTVVFQLLEAGLDEAFVEELLSSVIIAVREEYGD